MVEMRRALTGEQLWKQFCSEKGVSEESYYEAWAFGGAPDKLADLVIRGIKTATASLYYWYKDGRDRLPEAGDYSVILNSKDEAVCVIQTTKIMIVPYKDVPAEFAYKEGEGDKSLEYWRTVHKEFFTEELADTGLEFTEDLEIVCEEFELVYGL